MKKTYTKPKKKQGFLDIVDGGSIVIDYEQGNHGLLKKMFMSDVLKSRKEIDAYCKVNNIDSNKLKLMKD